VIYEALRHLQDHDDKHRKLHAFAKYLIEVRGEKPNHAIYEALIAANRDISGSADDVRDLLREMRNSGLEASANMYETTLLVGKA
jgi:hypothetical protein